MIVFPQAGVFPMREAQLECDVECDGLLISFSVKMILLLVGSWAVFFRHPKATLPRIFLYRSLVGLLLLVFTFTFWLFYVVRMSDDFRRRITFFDIVQYAGSMVDTLLFVHFIAVLLIEIRHMTPHYHVKVVRSPDGVSKTYAVGALSIQRAAAFVLEKYYTEFSIYNPYLESLPTSTTLSASGNVGGRKGNYKYYDVDGIANPLDKVKGQTSLVI